MLNSENEREFILIWTQTYLKSFSGYSSQIEMDGFSLCGWTHEPNRHLTLHSPKRDFIGFSSKPKQKLPKDEIFPQEEK